jgi:hypothetical protein
VTGLSRTTLRRLILAGIALALAVALALGLYHPDIDQETATRLADRMQADYRRDTAEPVQNFSGRETALWSDGWEFRWRYRPCPAFASLRIWISRDGRRARYAEMPDCAPDNGVGTTALKV